MKIAAIILAGLISTVGGISTAHADTFQHFDFASGVYKAASGCRFIIDQVGWTVREITLWNARDDHSRRDCSAIDFEVKPSDVVYRGNGIYTFSRFGNHMTLKVNAQGQPVSITMTDGDEHGSCSGSMSFQEWPSNFDRMCQGEE